MLPTMRCLTLAFLAAFPRVVNAQDCPPPNRPFFEFQVERPATFIADSAVSPYPVPPAPGRPRGEGTLVSFVVDTAGRPDTVSYKVIRETEPGLGEAARAVLARWRYRPAHIRGGCVVSQLIQTLITRR